MTRIKPAVLALLSALAGATGVNAADLVLRPGLAPPPPVEHGFNRFYLHIGPAGLIYSEGAKMSAGGSRIPGADVRIPTSATGAVEIGYFFTPNFAIGFAGGYPPRTKVEAQGSIRGLGTLGKIDGGPAALTAQWHFTGLGAFQPYIGAGPAALIVFANHDGAVNDLKTDHALGFTGQIGFNYMINEQWGAFVDVKKVYLRADAKGTLGGAPIKATVKLDPLVVHTGITYRF